MTLNTGDALTGQLAIGASGGTHDGSMIIDMGAYAGLDSSDQATATAAANAMSTALNAGLGATTLSHYSVAMDTATGVLSISTGTAGETLVASSNNMTEAAPSNTAVDIYTSDGTSGGSADYIVTVGLLDRSHVGTTSVGGTQSLNGTDLSNQGDAKTALTDVTLAIGDVAYQRGQVGANINTLTAASNIESAQQTNVVSAENSVTATDYASATSNMSKFEILTQTGISALAQANSTQQMVTKLLQ